MSIIKRSYLLVIVSAVFLSACARDLSSNVYTSSSTLSLTLKGQIVSAREVTIKKSDDLENSKYGTLAGGGLGAIMGSTVGGGSGQALATVGTGIVGALAGAAIENTLTKQNGYEYIIDVDTTNLDSEKYIGSKAMRDVIATAKTNGLITVVQGGDTRIAEGRNVYVIYSDNRVRVTAVN